MAVLSFCCWRGERTICSNDPTQLCGLLSVVVCTKALKQEFLGTEFTQTSELVIQVKTVKLVNNIIYVGKSNKDIETSEPIKHDE